MPRTTRKDLDVTFSRMARAADAVGIDTSHVEFHHGSVTYGISWGLLDTDPEHSANRLPQTYLGSTAREALRTLTGMAVAFEAVAYARKAQGHE